MWWFFLTWLPDFFKQTRHLDIKSGGYMLATIYGIATVLSIFGGWVTGSLVKKGWTVTRARKTGMFIFACCVLPIVVVKNVGDCGRRCCSSALLARRTKPGRRIFSPPPLTCFRNARSPPWSASAAWRVPRSSIAFPIIAGVILDRVQGARQHHRRLRMVFAICAGAYLVAFVIQHVLAPRFEMVELEKPSGLRSGA